MGTRCFGPSDTINGAGKQESIMSHDQRPGPVTVNATVGKPLAAEPSPADYHDEIPEEMFAFIDAHCPQDLLSGGKSISKLDY